MASPGAVAGADVSYCSPGLAARPKYREAHPLKLSGTRTPTGQTLPPPPVKHLPTAVIGLSSLPAWLLLVDSATSVPTSEGEAGTNFSERFSPYFANSARYFLASASGLVTMTSR